MPSFTTIPEELQIAILIESMWTSNLVTIKVARWRQRHIQEDDDDDEPDERTVVDGLATLHALQMHTRAILLPRAVIARILYWKDMPFTAHLYPGYDRAYAIVETKAQRKAMQTYASVAQARALLRVPELHDAAGRAARAFFADLGALRERLSARRDEFHAQAVALEMYALMLVKAARIRWVSGPLMPRRIADDLGPHAATLSDSEDSSDAGDGAAGGIAVVGAAGGDGANNNTNGDDAFDLSMWWNGYQWTVPSYASNGMPSVEEESDLAHDGANNNNNRDGDGDATMLWDGYESASDGMPSVEDESDLMHEEQQRDDNDDDDDDDDDDVDMAEDVGRGGEKRRFSQVD